MTGWVSRARAAMRSRLWPFPVIVVAIAVAAGLLLPRLDAHVDSGLPPWLDDILFGGDPGAARTVLDAVASSLITVTSLTFSLTVVTLQLASSQFSPRLLRTFTRDLFVQATLALFLGTFAYSLAVLRSVRSIGNAGNTGLGGFGFVPQIAVTAAFVLALASVIGLVLFLAHLAAQIRVETMLQAVHQDASATVGRVLGKTKAKTQTSRDSAAATDGRDALVCIPRSEHQDIITAPRSGFVTHVDEEGLLAAAVAADALLVIDRHTGSFIVAGTPIGACWAWDGGHLAAELRAELDDRVHPAVHTGVERTETQDVGYGLRQLTDVAVKALSPGINDPTTAVHALDHTAALLCEMATCDLGRRLLRDDEHRVRVILHRPELGDLLELALTQPRRYGAADPAVLDRLFQLLAEVAWHAGPDRQAVIVTQLDRLVDTAAAQDFDPTETARHRHLAQIARYASSGDWPTGGGG